MKNVLKPVARESLVDRLAGEIRTSINSGDYTMGERLPTIMEMARRFGVGHPTVREALKKLEAIGVVEIRHGSGVYVTRTQDVLVMRTATSGYFDRSCRSSSMPPIFGISMSVSTSVMGSRARNSSASSPFSASTH